MHIHLQLVLALSHIHKVKILHRDLTLGKKIHRVPVKKQQSSQVVGGRWMFRCRKPLGNPSLKLASIMGFTGEQAGKAQLTIQGSR